VIVPTFNERATIAVVVERLFATEDDRTDLLVVDDGSPDGTGDAVRGLKERFGGLHLLERSGKQGLASAYLTGFAWATERGYDAVVEMDGDLSHDPAAVPALLDSLSDAELVVGSRYVSGGAIENWSVPRLPNGVAAGAGSNRRVVRGLRLPDRDDETGAPVRSPRGRDPHPLRRAGRGQVQAEQGDSAGGSGAGSSLGHA
jgi:glycosyltransferase involved in cell wall biosynthesis